MKLHHALFGVTLGCLLACWLQLRRCIERRREERVRDMLSTPFGQDPITKTPENIRYIGPSIRRPR